MKSIKYNVHNKVQNSFNVSDWRK